MRSPEPRVVPSNIDRMCIAAGVDVKVRTMRLNEGSGEKYTRQSFCVRVVFSSGIGGIASERAVSMRLRRWASVDCVNNMGSFMFVTRSVFEGGSGWTRGGRSERSRDNEGPEELDFRDRGGVSRAKNTGEAMTVKLDEQLVFR